MAAAQEWVQDVMQVCRNGHVITDLLRSKPETGLRRCDRCGADTLEGCPTCGRELPGAFAVPGLQPVGSRRAPLYCATCGAAFPWAPQPPISSAVPALRLEALLIRLPRVIRALRVRHGGRTPFRVEDEKDLEDLLRALLPLQADDVRPQVRTPRYDPGTRTDFLLAAERIAVTGKLARAGLLEAQLQEQFAEDAAHYRQRGDVCQTLVGFVHDPEGLVRDPRGLAAACARLGDELAVRCVVGGL